MMQSLLSMKLLHLQSSPLLLRMIHCSQSRLSGENWRVRNGLSRSGNEYGPLVSKSDWSYCDGRPCSDNKGKEKPQKFLHSDRIKQLLRETQVKNSSS